jgi:dUTP pyrophosphatase
MRVLFKKVHPNAKTPQYSLEGDACLDLYAAWQKIDDLGNRVYGTGIAMEIPRGHVGLLFPRSSISKTNLSLRNSVGVIDSNYRGEIMLKFLDLEEMGDLPGYLPGNKIGQIMIIERPEIQLGEVAELSDSVRGEGGFGSTGS